MLLKFENQNNGIKLSYNNHNFALVYPKEVWQAYPQKELLIDNIANLLTISLPITSSNQEINYNTSKPFFHKQFKRIIFGDIPCSADDYKSSPKEIIKDFKNIRFRFSDNQIKKSNYSEQLQERAIIPLSCGKDSLLTLALSKELNLNPIAVYINDTISPTENRIKLKHSKELTKEQGIPLIFIKNTIEQLNDFEFWNKDESCTNYAHMITGFCFISLPLTHYYKAKYVILGNQKDMDFSFKGREGHRCYAAYDQTSLWQKKQNKMIKKLTNKQVNIISLIRPLTNIAITKILFSRYPKFAKYQVSCDCLDVSDEKRWCLDCNKCARLSLFMMANNINPKIVKLKPLLDKEHEKLYCLFNGKEVDHYEKTKEAREQQLLAFYMVYKNGYDGYLIRKFKELFLEEAKTKENYLYKKFFKIYDANLPKNIKKKLFSIYKKELSESKIALGTFL